MYDIELKENEWDFFNLSKNELELQIMLKKSSIEGGFKTKHKVITLKKLEKELNYRKFDKWLEKLSEKNGITEY